MPITFKQVGHIYQADTPFSFTGLTNVSLHIEKGDYIALIGHTGSGKSTLIQHLNALLKPSSGTVIIDDVVIDATTKEKNLKPLRQKVGVVFQFPESQLFDETVLKDVMFGPMNFGNSEADAKIKAEKALQQVGIAPELYMRSPFELSGGQMRRVAIAGILAMQPEVLVLDEPTAGLDPKTRNEMMQLFKQLHEQQGMTIVLVTHQMDDVANYANKVGVLKGGQLLQFDTPANVFKHRQWLIDHQIGVPNAMAMAHRLREKNIPLDDTILTSEQFVAEIVKQLGGKTC